MEETRLLEEDADDTDGDKHTHVVVLIVIVFLQVDFVCCSFLRFGDFLLRWVAKGEGESAPWAARDKGEGDVPSIYQLMSAYKDRSRHLTGETSVCTEGTT